MNAVYMEAIPRKQEFPILGARFKGDKYNTLSPG